MNNELEYRIKTIADLRAMERTHGALKDVQKALKDQGKESEIVNSKIAAMDRAMATETAQAVKLADSLNKVVEAERKAGRSAHDFVAARNSALQGAGLKAPGRLQEAALAFKDAGGGMSGLSAGAAALGPEAVAAVAAGTLAIKGATSAIREFGQSEESIIRLDAALAQAGLLTEDYRRKLLGLASDLQDTTGKADEEWTDVIRTLTQLGSTPDDIEKNVEAVKNLAGILDGDLTSAAMMVGKALQGEFTAFSRLGIEFDEHASKAENLAKLYKVLAERGAGQLEAAATSLNGKLRTLKNAFSDLEEAAGPYVLNAVLGKNTIDGLTLAFKWLAEKIGDVPPVAGNLQNKIKGAKDAMDRGAESADQFAEKLKKVKGQADDAAASLNKYFQELGKKTQRDQDQEGAAADLALSELKRKEKAGLITPAESRIAEHQIKERVEADRIDREAGLRDQSIAKLKAAADDNADRMSNANLQAQAEEDKAKQYARDHEAMKATAKKFDDQIAAANASGDTDTAAKLAKAKAERIRKFRGESGNVDAQEKLAKDKRTAADDLIKELFPKQADYLSQIQSLEDEKSQMPRIYDLQARKRRIDTGVEVAELKRKEEEEKRQKQSANSDGRGGKASANPADPFNPQQPLGPNPRQLIQGDQVPLDRFEPRLPMNVAGAQEALKRQEQYWIGILDGLLKVTNWQPVNEARFRQVQAKIEAIDNQLSNMRGWNTNRR